jgi:hypothetical protein
VTKQPGKEAAMKRNEMNRAPRREVSKNQVLAAIRKCLPKKGLPLQVDDQRVRWTPRLLVTAAILMSWKATASLQDAFAWGRECVVAMYGTRRRPGGSYQGFIARLRRQSAELLETVVSAFRAATRKVAGEAWQTGRWVLMGADGSRVNCPRTEANEQAFGCAGRKKTGPQLFLTVLYHVATRLPWAWRRGGGKASEKHHLLEMIPLLPESTMLLADAGFPTFDVLVALQQAGVEFVVRVGSNVHLLGKLYGKVRTKSDGIVWLWPQAKQNEAPLILRLTVVRDSGKPVYLITSVLDASVLSDAEVGRMYRLRWGVEVFYRSLKQTMSHGKLRSGQPDNAKVELDWGVVGLWMLGLATIEAMDTRRRPPGDWSVASALRAMRRAVGRPYRPQRRDGLRKALRQAVQDTYQRRSSKAARNWPHKKTEHPAGPPNLRMATKQERQRAKAFAAPEATT